MPRAKQPSRKRRAPPRAKHEAASPAIEAAASPLFHYGLVIAAAVLLLDQATKYLVLYGLDLATRRTIYVAPFLDFVLAMNRGISYGLFPQDGEFGRWLLFAVKIGAAIWFFYWLRYRAPSKLAALSLGLLIGGAIGNAIDRAVQGAVVDFVSLHAAGFRWYIFNLADAAIVAGVAGLLYDALTANALKSPPKRGI